MDFDPLSYGLGFASSTALSLAVWRYRVRLARLQEAAESGIEGTRKFIGQAADARYVRDVARYAQHYHIAGSLFDLQAVLVEPRLLAPPPPVIGNSMDEAEPLTQDIFRAVPVFHDLPQAYAPYNLQTIPLSDLGSGDRHIAILGIPGIGKSTTLAVLALMALGEISFESREDLSQQAATEEEQGLSELERTQRARERQQIQERARQKIEQARRLKEEQILKVQEQLPTLEIAGLLPILVHLNDLEFDPAIFGRKKSAELDPAEPLVRAVERYVSTVTAQVTGSVIYPALERGRALILIDGYDELSPAARQPYFHWLGRLLETYSQNMIVITGPATGYDSLMALGFTPAFLRAWTPGNFTELAEQWALAWTRQRDKRASRPDDQVMRRLAADNRGRCMLNVTLKLWAGLADDTRQTGRIGWYDALINRRLSAPQTRDLLPALAERILENGAPVARGELQTLLAEALPGPQSPKEKDNRPAQAAEIINGWVKDGLLREVAGGRLTFPHPQITSFLASEQLVRGDPERAVELALNPAWKEALGFAAAKINMLPIIYRKLSVTPDLMFSDLFDLVAWMPDAPPDAPWRGDLFKRFAAALMAPEQFLTVRERAMAALIATRDRNVLFIFRQAIRSADANIRSLGCIGLGALGDPEAVRDLTTLLGDSDQNVQLAAALALGAIGTEQSLNAVVKALVQGSEQLRRAAAEALAALPGEGHEVLRDGIVSDNIDIRRASVFGLARINAPWALMALHRAMFEDEQFWVRTAAESAFMAAQAPHSEGPRAHPEADALGWLVAWAAEHGEGVPAGVNARQVLIRVLQEGEPEFKILSAQTMGQLGHVAGLKPLYAALRDRQPGVRDAVYTALSNIQTRLGSPLPGVV